MGNCCWPLQLTTRHLCCWGIKVPTASLGRNLIFHTAKLIQLNRIPKVEGRYPSAPMAQMRMLGAVLLLVNSRSFGCFNNFTVRIYYTITHGMSYPGEL